MTYEELQNCILPVEVIGIDHGELFEITAYNSKALLFTEKRSGNEFYDDIDFLQFVELKPQITTVKLYKYNYFDKLKKEKASTSWTTEGFSKYWGVDIDVLKFELMSAEIKTVEIED